MTVITRAPDLRSRWALPRLPDVMSETMSDFCVSGWGSLEEGEESTFIVCISVYLSVYLYIYIHIIYIYIQIDR